MAANISQAAYYELLREGEIPDLDYLLFHLNWEKEKENHTYKTEMVRDAELNYSRALSKLKHLSKMYIKHKELAEGVPHEAET